MGGLTRETVVSVSAGRVFNYVADPHNAPHYISSIARITSGPEGVPVEGDVWRAEVNFLGKRSTVALRLAELQANHLVKFTIEGEPHATLTLRLTPKQADTQTAISLHMDVQSVPDIFLNALMGNLLSADISRLKNVLESAT